jgi:hypothetical protein
MSVNRIIAAVCLAGVVSASPGADIVLKADDNDGHDNVWEKRYDAGKNSWGIEGNHRVTSGDMWFAGFPGSDGTYRVTFGVVLEEDGQPKYKVTAGGQTLGQGEYPWPNGDACAGKGTKASVIDFGEHDINQGDKINVWGESTYECSPEHGAYTRWYELRFTPLSTNPDPGTPTEIVSPEDGAELTAGATITLSGRGDNPRWSYDANSDGLGRIDIGEGDQVEFTVPDNVDSPREITIFLVGDEGEVSHQCTIAELPTTPRVTVLAPDGGETYTEGETLWVQWEADTTQVTDVDILFSDDNGRNWTKLNTESSVSLSDKDLWGNFPWRIPFDGTLKEECMIRVEKYDSEDPLMKDVSDGYFVIEPNTSTVAGRRSARNGSVAALAHDGAGAYTLRIRSASRVRVSLVDMRGARVFGWSVRGPSERRIDGGMLSPGVYFVEILSGRREISVIGKAVIH